MSFRILGACLITLLAAACGAGDDGPETPTGPSPATTPSVTAVSVSCTPQGATQQCTATARLSNDATENITARAAWTSSNTGVATVDASGLVANVATGETLITAEYQGTTGRATISVSVTVATIAVRCTQDAATHQCTATASLSNDTTQDVSAMAAWTSTNTAVATVTAGGRVTHLSSGDAEIRATYQNTVGGTKIDVKVSVTRVAVVCVPEEGAHQCSATATLSNGTTRDATAFSAWESSDPIVANVNSTGRVTSSAAGSAQISATFGEVTGRATVTVILLGSLTVTCAPLGNAHQCSATANFSDGSRETVTSQATWVSTNTRVGQIDAAGRVTHLDTGQTEIRATYKKFTGSMILSIGVPLSGTGVVINEFASRKADVTRAGKFVELRNDAAHSVDIGGWQLMTSPSQSVTFQPGLTLGPGCHLLIASAAAELREDIGSSLSGLHDNGGVALVRPDGSIVDQVGISELSPYGEGRTLPGFPESAKFVSYARVGNDTNDNVSDFVLGLASPTGQTGSCAVR